MQHELNHTVQETLGARGLEEVSRETLAVLVQEFPYAALLHLLYSRKLQQAQDPQYAVSVARTALYFSNPHWLHHLLRPKTSREAVLEMEQAFDDHQQDTTPVETEPGKPADISSPAEAMVTQEGSGQPLVAPMEALVSPETEEADTGLEEQPAPDSQEHSRTTWEAPDVRALEEAPESPEIDMPSIVATYAEAAVAEEAPGIQGAADEPVADVVESDPPAPVDEIEPIAPGHAQLPVSGPTLTTVGPLAPADTGLIPLEPYYTIDYFASQGIQLSEEEKQDPLGRKLKRFTEWLKTMKKIHPEKAKPAGSEGQSDDSIREGAEHSNDRSDVVTEAMAEVYLKQGLQEKAVDIYRKLSLLDPSRSATFAAKIAELNTPGT
jgi:hypothetical protein